MIVPAVAAFAMLGASDARAQATPADAPPAEATTCVAIVLPSVHGVEGSATDVATSLRELFESYLTGPSIKSVGLDARLASQALEEARQKQCDHLLVTTLTRKRSGGGSLGRALGQAAGTAAWYIPGGGVARGAAIAGSHAVSSLAGSTRAKDEMRLDYKISTLDAASRASTRTLKAKAASDGEDLLTPLVEQVSEAVAAAVAKR
ncbi:MAG TPA: hypothetical protein VK911_00360 [Vicinamibacterales bacterium]|nr:hypothetical protein [Vicinamibacterales bacterium]